MNYIKISPRWPKSKEEIWKETFEPLVNISDNEPREKNNFRRCLPAYSIAAAIIIFLIISIQLYTVTVVTPRGKQQTFLLPDKSTVHLNADSRISYRPYLWIVSRSVNLDGEACFEVVSGRRFTVCVAGGKVKALGTVFNVYSRKGMCRVTCHEGSVAAITKDSSVIISTGMKAVRNGQDWIVDKSNAAEHAPGWTLGRFEFINTPLQEVVEEIERQYDIRIVRPADINRIYTGAFQRTVRPEEALAIIGKPFGISFVIE
jgi:ferric-dicitrate binding protein FerR (iron transport regulator)